MNIFLLATIACVVIYYGSRIGLTLYVSAKGIDLTQKGTKIEGFLPNLLAVGVLVGYLGMVVNGTLLAALTVKHYLL